MANDLHDSSFDDDDDVDVKEPPIKKRKANEAVAAASSAAKSRKNPIKLVGGRGKAKSKKGAIVKSIPKLAPDWPVTSSAPKYPADASALTPGSLLQEKCTGHDIQLSRTAAAGAAAQKEKGKFLLLFPGQFSFHKMQQQAQTSNNKKDPGDKEEDNSDVEDLTMDDNNNGNMASKQTPSKKPAADLPSLGTLEGVRTDTPTFKIPFPDQYQLLVFPGKKVPTTSKFIMLSCANKQKAAVQCKSIFSLAIVFGAPKWEAMKGKSEANPSAGNTAVNSNGSGAAEWTHYGGSARAMARGQKKENGEPVVSIPIVHRKGAGRTSTSIFGFPGMEEPEPAPSDLNLSTKAADAAQYSTDENLIDEDASESDFSLELALPKKVPSAASATKARAAPRRQASLKRKAYAGDNDDADGNSSDSSSGDDSDVKEVPPPKKTVKAAAPKRQASQKRKAPAAKTKEASDESSDNDSDDYVEEIVPVSKRARTSIQAKKKEDESSNEDPPPPSKRAKVAAASKSAIESSDDHDEDFLSPERPEKKKTFASSTAKARPGRKSAEVAKKKVVDILDSSSEDNGSDGESEDDVAPPAKAAKKKLTTAKSNPSAKPKARSRKKESTVVKKLPAKASKPPATEKNGAKTTADTTPAASVTQPSPEPKSPSATAKASPFRRRRKAKSPGSTSGAKKSLSLGFSSKSAFDLTADSDDEFNFG